MTPRKTALVLYLTIWTSIIAYVSFKLAVESTFRKSDELSPIVPFASVPIALGIALHLVRSSGLTAWKRLRLYMWVAPIALYFALLATVTVAVGLNHPGAAPLVFVFGFLFGLPALIVGMIFHAVGILPLWFVEQTIFSCNEQPEHDVTAATRQYEKPKP